MFKKIAIAAALSAAALSASAMVAVGDEELSQVSGQDGVSIFADLKVNVGSFVYTDGDANGGKITMSNLNVTGPMAFAIDIVNSATFFGAIAPYLSATQTAAQLTNLTGYYGGAMALLANPAATTAGDVVRISMPDVAITSGLNVSVGGIALGNNAASMGSIALNNIQLGGTNVYIWAH